MTAPEFFQQIPVKRDHRRRRIAVSVGADGTIVIHAPLHAGAGQIAQAWRKLAPWAERKRALLARHPEARPHLFRFAPGATFFHLGRELPLLTADAPPGTPLVRLTQDALLAASGDPELIRQGLEGFYRDETRRLVTAKVATLAERYGITVRSITIRGARRRFGSCNTAGDLNFSWRLAMYPERLIDLIVCHELAHRTQMNHSPAFYETLAHYLPDHRERERELRLWSRKLSAYPE